MHTLTVVNLDMRTLIGWHWLTPTYLYMSLQAISGAVPKILQ